MTPANPGLDFALGRFQAKKWVRHPMGKRQRAIHPLSVTRNHAYALRTREERVEQPQNRARPALAGTPAHAFDINGAKARLCAADGGYEIVDESQRLQLCVYTLVAPEPDHRRVNEGNELYVVLEGTGTLDVGGERLELSEFALRRSRRH